MDVELIDKMGSDLSVVNAARVSFAKIKDELDDNDDWVDIVSSRKFSI